MIKEMIEHKRFFFSGFLRSISSVFCIKTDFDDVPSVAEFHHKYVANFHKINHVYKANLAAENIIEYESTKDISVVFKQDLKK